MRPDALSSKLAARASFSALMIEHGATLKSEDEKSVIEIFVKLIFALDNYTQGQRDELESQKLEALERAKPEDSDPTPSLPPKPTLEGTLSPDEIEDVRRILRDYPGLVNIILDYLN